MELIIDHREKDLKKYYQTYENVSFDNLDLGDIKFNYNGEIFLLIERKTIKDFVSSIKDKRYSEQKLRLKNNIELNKILYLIEGNIEDYSHEKIDGIPKKTIISTLISLLLKDNIKVYQTASLKGSLEFISRIYHRLKEKPENIILNSKQNSNLPIDDENKYCNYIKLKKKDNLTSNICYISQLSQIPGISNKIASQIANKYTSMIIICKECSENPNLLENFEYIISDDKIRKLGKKKNATIYNFLFNKIE